MDLAEFERMLAELDATTLAKVQSLAAPVLERCWTPQPGPQSDAYFSLADEMLYGGAAGGGKTDLLAGLATTKHIRTLLLRRQSSDLDAMWERIKEVLGTNLESSNDNKRVITTRDNRLIEGGHLEKPGSEKSWQGRPHDLIGVDEAAQVDENKVLFVLQWLRSTVPGQRVRAIFATNPPLPEYKDGHVVDAVTGDWLLRWFAPWIDETFANPAQPGELRWCYMVSEGQRHETVWVEGPGYYDKATQKLLDHTPTEAELRSGKIAAAKSRTFIRSLLKDNAYLIGTGYAERLSTTPEPLRTMLMQGVFGVRLEDHAFQVIPTNWVIQANERWQAIHDSGAQKNYRQVVLSGDIAQGGADRTTLAPLYTNNYFGPLISQPGRKTPDGPAVSSLVVKTRKHQSKIVLDGGGGWAGDTRRTLERDHGIEAELFQPGGNNGDATQDGRYMFLNNRAAAWWKLREDLSPDSGMDIALPPDPRLLSQLTAPHFVFVKGDTIAVESKEDIRKRIQSSTDDADAVVMGWYYRDDALLEELTRKDPPRAPNRAAEVANMVDEARSILRSGALDDYDPLGSDEYDPLKDWHG